MISNRGCCNLHLVNTSVSQQGCGSPTYRVSIVFTFLGKCITSTAVNLSTVNDFIKTQTKSFYVRLEKSSGARHYKLNMLSPKSNVSYAAAHVAACF